MTVDSETRRLTKNELMMVEKTLFELTRKQKGQDSPVHIPMPEGLGFWSSVGQLLQHMETELSETVREEGMNAKAQLLSRRLGVARTCVRDLTRMRLLAFTRHAMMSNLLSDEQGGLSMRGLGRVEWERHDPSERIFYNGIMDLAERYKRDTSWSSMLGGDDASIASSAPVVHDTLSQFSEGEEVSARVPPAAPLQEGAWEEPELDEEDRIRDMDVFPEHASSRSESRSVQQEQDSPGEDLLRIRILKDVSDPIVTSDGTEMVLEEGDIESCPSLIAETLIAAGLAEAAPI
ncbi:MAG: hypothetical protein CMB03_01310 [Euryarchaeota archaeon]|nr:hypothetical protein [Euryarchaeota archaeon]